MQIKDYDLIKDIDVLFDRKIIIYGAGTYGIRTAQLLEDAGVGFECFCDRNEEIVECLNHPVITLDEMQDIVNDQEYMIVVGSEQYREEIIEELTARNIWTYTCTWYGIQAGIELHIEDQRLPEWFQQDIIYKRKMMDLYMKAKLGVTAKTWHNPIFDYVPPKVGSTTVYETLKKAGIEVVHLHNLRSTTGYKAIDGTRTYLRKKIQRGGTKIITLVRDPIAKALSQFMQDFYEVAISSRVCSHDLEAETKRWMASMLETNNEFLWFDRQIKEVTGVDIYQYSFDKDRGYAWIKEGDIEILILKMEMLSKNVSIISEFVGKLITELVNDNIGSEKVYKYIYEELKKRIRIPAELVVSQYKDNKYVDHFYTEEEKEQFCKKWIKNIEGGESELRAVQKWKGYSDKHLALFKMMCRWVAVKQEGKSLVDYFVKNNYKTIAIYGMSYVGECLAGELDNTDIEVKYGIDKNVNAICTTIDVYSPEDDLEPVDVVVVTPIFFFNEIKKELGRSFDCPIISLEDIINEL